ncbi:kinase-like protein [Rickenella mellea]|uniref:Kinase-like protein n=1 Tax=Rickenella mellea TaxID=50990 RepID=A0A4Y7Q3K6_9AGAM|nr:kinase-like protein [Rickenella mellea]
MSSSTCPNVECSVEGDINDHMDTSRKPYQTSLFATLLYKYSPPSDDELSRVERLKEDLNNIMKSIARSTNNRDPELAAIAFLKVLPKKSDLDNLIDEPIPSPPVLRINFEYPSYPSTVVAEGTYPYGLDVPLDGLEEWWNRKDNKCSEQPIRTHDGQTLVGYVTYQQLRNMAGKVVFIMDTIQNIPDNRYAKNLTYLANLNPFALRPFLRLPHILPHISGGAADGILDFLEDQSVWQESVALISDQQQAEITQMVADQVMDDSQMVEVHTDDIQSELSKIGVPVELVHSVPLRSNNGDIGSGSSGTIRRTRTMRTNEKVAVKGFRKERVHINRLLHEAKIWKDLKHKNILPLLGFCIISDEDVPGLVSPECKYGNVRLFFEQANVTIAFKLRLLHPSQLNHILNGVEYLHSKGIAHGDLRTQNILLNGGGEAIICDFGISDVIEECDNLRSESSITNARWLAYEFFDENNQEPLRIDGPSDMYSFGCLTFEVISQKLPFYDLTENELISSKRGYEWPTRPDDVEDIYWNFMTAFWGRFKQSRPTATEGLTLLKNAMATVFEPNSAEKIDMLFKCPMSFFCDW